jgi:hypothetical protein
MRTHAAAIQGLLLNHKHRPAQVIKEVPDWVEKERAARLARERAISLAEGRLKIEEVSTPDPQQPSPPPENQEEKLLGSDPGRNSY